MWGSTFDQCATVHGPAYSGATKTIYLARGPALKQPRQPINSNLELPTNMLSTMITLLFYSLSFYVIYMAQEKLFEYGIAVSGI